MLSFVNPGEIDMKAVEVMGLSAKTGDSPIGRFGTGLKYAIAITLRVNGHITIYSGTNCYKFEKNLISFRGKSIEQVVMSKNGGPFINLPFTNDYGQDWEPWQALRELESNARDEGGHSSPHCISPQDGFTTIHVSCPEIEKAYLELPKLFLETRAVANHMLKHAEIHTPTHHTRDGIYYRGVRVADCEKPALYVYNFNRGLTLTEDRTLSFGCKQILEWQIASTIAHCDSREVITNVLEAPSHTFEDKLPWYSISYYKDDLFWQIVAEYVNEGRANYLRPVLLNTYYKGAGLDDELYKPYKPNAREAKMLAEAYTLLAEFNPPEAKIVEALNDDALGLAYKGKIYLAKRNFDMGLGTLVGTLFEETAHHKHGYHDCSRTFQQYLIDTISRLLIDLDFANKPE